MKRTILLFTITLLLGGIAHAGTIDDATLSCKRANPHGGKHWLEECVEELLTLDPIHPILHTIGPNTGPGLGLGFSGIWRRGELEYQPSINAVISTNGSLEVQPKFVFAFPAISFSELPSQDSSEDLNNKSANDVALITNSVGIESKASLTFQGSWIDAKGQKFYGIGPSTSLSQAGEYSLEKTYVGAAANDPITSWAAIGFTTNFIRPRIISAGNPLVQQVYTSMTAPGLGTHLSFMEYEPYVHLQLSIPKYRLHPDIKIGYGFYQDLDGPQFSFQRVYATTRVAYEIWLPSVGTASHRSALKNFLCEPTRGARHCSVGLFTLTGDVAAARTGTGSVVPFYFQETLGGADADGVDTLRGFPDQRFTGPSRVLFQAEYDHPVWGPIGFMSFYDLGKVSQRTADLGLNRGLHRDVGVGFTVASTKRVVMRVYWGFDTGEPLLATPGVKFGAIP